MPYLSTWYMEKAAIPGSFKIFFSPASTSLNPIYAIFFGLKLPGTHLSDSGQCGTSLFKPIRNDTGQPCKFPEGVLSMVFISAWASIHKRPASGYLSKTADTVPMAIEWSPPKVKGNLFAWTTFDTELYTNLVASPTKSALLALTPVCHNRGTPSCGVLLHFQLSHKLGLVHWGL